MKYTITFCVFDHTVGGNPFWHGSFFLSMLDENKQLLEVVETWGFYGVTSTGDKSSWLEQFKNKYHLDVDFQGNHGMLINEEVRFMDLGHGLHGYTFELAQDEFELLQKRCANAVAEQEAAIKEVVGDGQHFKTDPEKKGRVYQEEAYSRQIFEIEQIKAKIEGRPSRLKPFDFHLSFGLSGPSLKNSNTCKTRAVSLLEGILTEEQLAPFKNSSLPRLIPGLEPILLHSEGPLHIHKKSSGKEVFYRDKKQDKEVKLYWSVPPQRFDQLSADTESLFKIDEEYRDEVKYIVSQLQRLEWLIRNASLPEKYKEYQNDLIQRIVSCYKAFAIIEPKNDSKISGWQGSILGFFSVPRSQEEKKLQDKIHQAKMLLNALYMAIVDGWSIYDEYPSETTTNVNAEDYNLLEALVSYLSTEDKESLCKILGRPYLENEETQVTLPVSLPT
ncbi:hypothetical protein [Fluoribacter gormanii]|uniref:Uncharacterized protein n=1 Tax=Fluoribacter gormanii TaxID=464 RepID=A0A377GLH3_9GAMM|nr:hypothetical protein [Fluoribacter gormanii]KTD04025.1 hypothetical protein Lgor_1095 [Fluoribacter gormanii]SIR91499.1 hypothetical protein SAMN05421777_1432 [Fluoribacter gormanii]STO25689.1 Uncharacterised protein [Fluoribacter gormanii]